MKKVLLSSSGLLVALVLFLSINIISNETLTALRLDVTENKLYTLSDGTRNILASLDEPIHLRFYYSVKTFSDQPSFLSYGKRVRDMLGEYVAASKGQVKLSVIDPEPFSEAEDQAVGFGVRQLPLSATGEMGYLGLAGTNSTDDETLIPYLDPGRGDALEYEITKMIYTLAHPTKSVVGILSTLPMIGQPAMTMGGNRTQGTPDWVTTTYLREFFELRDIGTEVEEIDSDIDTLLVVHPKELTRATLYAIDQFVLHGGHAMVFIDPMAEEDRQSPDPANPMVQPKIDSDLDPILAAWGVKMIKDKVVGDIDAAVRVQFAGNRGPQQVEYLPWLQLKGEGRLNQDDFTTNQLTVVNFGSAGVLETLEGATTTVTPLISTGPNSAMIDRDAIIFVRDPSGLLEKFAPDGKPKTIAARIHGVVKTAFPDGRPKSEEQKRAPEDENFIAESDGPINVIVVADTDILADRFWVRFQNFLGTRVPNPFANNADFLINAIDNLGGNDDLISLRSRGEYARPFEVVQQIQREAEARFRDEERALQDKLEETERKISELQQSQEGTGEMLLSAEQKSEIDDFRAEQIKTRKQLRGVQHDLQKNIERLGTWLKFGNIFAIPILVALFAVTLAFVNVQRRLTK